jgi:hypothetical protein
LFRFQSRSAWAEEQISNLTAHLKAATESTNPITFSDGALAQGMNNECDTDDSARAGRIGGFKRSRYSDATLNTISSIGSGSLNDRGGCIQEKKCPAAGAYQENAAVQTATVASCRMSCSAVCSSAVTVTRDNNSEEYVPYNGGMREVESRPQPSFASHAATNSLLVTQRTHKVHLGNIFLSILKTILTTIGSSDLFTILNVTPSTQSPIPY